MKNYFAYLMLFFFSVTIFSCNNANSVTEAASTIDVPSGKIVVYYFHLTRRCITCKAVETITKEALNEYFSDKMKDETIVFKSVNLDENEGKELAKKLEVAGQSLLFVTENSKVDLTNDGFMYAKSSPEKLKAAVKSTVEELVK